ncbi:MAG: carbohydrate binding family 9 domain-containing protein, partial [Candidatus Aminicenantes bacterium]|nr:carbohydrate binding family 9 domain-containing protein [Candidatus Aminicenantes bacterium]
MKREFLFFLIIAQVFLYQSLEGVIFSAGPEGEADKILIPVRASVPPKIDGSLDDEAWEGSPLTKEFITYNPLYGEVLPQKTVIWLAYDSKNLYFAFKCYDTEPEKIKTSITKRDNIFSDDWVGLSLDSLGNKQSSYDLFVNPNGIQGDILNSAVGGEDVSPDFVWYSAGMLTDEGYQAEISIPLRSIRFKS